MSGELTLPHVTAEPTLAGRLEALGVAAHLQLSTRQIQQLELYLQTLARWNRTINLTALPLAGFPDEALARLVGEPLMCAGMLRDRQPVKWLDLGSGGGSPAIPMTIALSTPGLTMVESRSRKVAFLREVVRCIDLEGTKVESRRIEELADTVDRHSVDLVTIRAVRIDDSVAKVISDVCSADSRVAIFGQVDWTSLATDFSPVASKAGIVVLQPGLFHVEQSNAELNNK